MAKLKKNTVESTYRKKPKVRRPGIHAKTRASRGKKSKHYKKLYRGQGK
jgi:hypothetical protein